MRALVVATVLLLAACSAATPSPPPTGEASTPSSSSPAASLAASPTPASSPAASPAASPCLDAADLADRADPAVNDVQAAIGDLKVPNIAQARERVVAASAAIRSLAAFVAPAQPDAARALITVADDLDAAAPKLPADAAALDKANADLESALGLARTVDCPS